MRATGSTTTRAAIAGGFALSALACGAAPAAGPVVAPPAASAVAPAPAGFDEGRWRRFHSVRFDLSFALPDGSAWRIDDHRGPWLRATHAPTRSVLRVRAWREDRLVNQGACEAKARDLDPTLPAVVPERVVDDRPRRVGGEFESRLMAGTQPADGGRPGLGGYLLLFGANVRSCLAIVYETTAEGAGAERAVGERLAAVADGVVGSVAMDRNLAGPKGGEAPGTGR